MRSYKLLKDTEQRRKEIKTIFNQALKQRYPLRILKKWDNESKDISNRPKVGEKEEKNFRKITSTLDRKIKEILIPKGIRVIDKRDNTLFFKIRSDMEQKDKLDVPGIYKIPMKRGNETTLYIGRTQKAVYRRLKQHKDNVKSGSGATALAEGVRSEGWIPEWEKTEVLAKPRTLIRSILCEYIAIRNNRGNIINEPEYSDNWEGWRRAAGFQD